MCTLIILHTVCMLQVRLNLQVNLFPNQGNLSQPACKSTCFNLDTKFGAGKKHRPQVTGHYFPIQAVFLIFIEANL